MLKGIQLLFDGNRYSLWKQANISMSVDDLCAALSFTAAGIQNSEQMPLTPNTVFDVLLNDVPVVTARPDVIRKVMRETSHDIRIDARSLGRELVDCQFSKTLSGLRVAEIVKRLCEQFKVPLKIDAKETAVVKDFALQSETPANALINSVRSSNLLLYPQPDGGLILTEPTTEPPVAVLEFGKHFKQYEVIDEYRLRFSEYFVKAYSYEGNSAISGKKSDENLNFYRPLHIVSDRTGYGLGGCQRRAELEHNRRLARAHRLSIELAGWTWPESTSIWWGNQQVRVVIDHENIDDVLLISDVELSVDPDGGRVTKLQVMDRDAFISGKTKKAKKTKGGKK